LFMFFRLLGWISRVTRGTNEKPRFLQLIANVITSRNFYQKLVDYCKSKFMKLKK
jgi:hypothetical protein